MARNALCIGINNYPGTQMDLQGCVNDANDWAAALAERGFKVAKLLDEQATKAAMVAAMNDLIGKAGKSRWLGRRPHVRGVAMNPVDHPLGGGEGKSSGGRHPCTPWGVPTKGYKTRRNKRTRRMIVERRRTKKR